MLILNRLSGFGAWRASAAAAVELAFVTSATSTSSTITGPSSIIAGDLLVLLDSADDIGTVPTATVPSGFTILANTSDNLTRRVITSYKVATGSESNASLSGMSGLGSSKIIAVFRASSPISSGSPSTFSEQATNGNPSAQTVLSSSGAPPLVALGCYNSSGAIDPRTFTPAKDGEIANGTTLYLAYKIFNSAPENCTVDMDDEDGGGLGVNILQSGYIAISV